MRRSKKGYILIGIVAILAISAFAIPGVIPVGQISCESQFGPCRGKTQEALQKYQGQAVRKAKKEIGQMLSSEVFVESYDVRFVLPVGLKVVVIEKKPVYALRDLDKEAIALTDKEGYIVSIVEGTNLPVLSGVGFAIGVGEKVSGESLFALEILSEMFQFYQVKEGVLEKGGLSLELNEGAKVIFPLEGDKSVLISSLRLILSKLEEEEEGLSKRATIDLRFKNPVVTYQ